MGVNERPRRSTISKRNTDYVYDTPQKNDKQRRKKLREKKKREMKANVEHLFCDLGEAYCRVEEVMCDNQVKDVQFFTDKPKTWWNTCKPFVENQYTRWAFRCKYIDALHR